MPSLGADMDAGRLLEWRVKPGDRVKRGDIVAVVDTSKAEIEIEVFEDGEIEELLVPIGERVPVGTPIATIRAAEPHAAEPAAPKPAAAEPVARASEPGVSAPVARPGPPAAPPPRAPAPALAAADGRPQSAPPHRRRISPLARRTAADLGVDLASVEGSGPHGAVRQADVLRLANAGQAVPPGREQVAAPPAPPARKETPDRAAAMRDAIAKLMARSKREIPHYYLGTEIDMSAALAWMEERNRELPLEQRLLPSVLIAKAVALAAGEVPELNGFWTDDAFRPSSAVHLGFAVSLRGGGLIAPAIHDADRKSLGELMRAVRDLVRRTRAGTLRASEMSDPTVTLSSLGDRGVETLYGVIYPPQVALVGFGRVQERPVAVDGMLAVRPLATATLAADHRASDGHSGARFLAAVKEKLQHPGDL
jgi:pyruvate/2-oxoglutarate dehydrogenase complex dihydrolipoamide acyltransferase (E2) component